MPIFSFVFHSGCLLGLSTHKSYVFMQSMLAEPDMRHIANTDAAAAWQCYPSLYQQLVLRCVAASQQLHGWLTAL